MRSAASQVLRLQVQRLQPGDILFAQMGELIEKLLERLACSFVSLREAVEGIESAGFAMFEDDAGAGNPVGAFANDQVADNVERAPCFFPFAGASFVGAGQSVRQTAQKSVQRGGSSGENCD